MSKDQAKEPARKLITAWFTSLTIEYDLQSRVQPNFEPLTKTTAHARSMTLLPYFFKPQYTMKGTVEPPSPAPAWRTVKRHVLNKNFIK